MSLTRSLILCLGFKQLKSWEQVLEKLQTNQNSAGTRPKFSFKRKDKSETPRSDAPKVEASIPAETINRSPTTHLPLTYKSECFLSLASFPNTSIPTGSELIITNLNDCVVDLMDNNGATMNPRAVHIRDVSNCVILLPAIEGSVLLYDLLRCVVVISGYHQVGDDLLSHLCYLLGVHHLTSFYNVRSLV